MEPQQFDLLTDEGCRALRSFLETPRREAEAKAMAEVAAAQVKWFAEEEKVAKFTAEVEAAKLRIQTDQNYATHLQQQLNAEFEAAERFGIFPFEYVSNSEVEALSSLGDERAATMAKSLSDKEAVLDPSEDHPEWAHNNREQDFDDPPDPYPQQNARILVGYQDDWRDSYEREYRYVTAQIVEGKTQATSWHRDRDGSIEISAPWGCGEGNTSQHVVDQSFDLDKFVTASATRVRKEHLLDRSVEAIKEFGQMPINQWRAKHGALLNDQFGMAACLRLQNDKLRVTEAGAALLGLDPQSIHLEGRNVVVAFNPGNTELTRGNEYAESHFSSNVADLFTPTKKQPPGGPIAYTIDQRPDYGAMDPYERKFAREQEEPPPQFCTFPVGIDGVTEAVNKFLAQQPAQQQALVAKGKALQVRGRLDQSFHAEPHGLPCQPATERQQPGM